MVGPLAVLIGGQADYSREDPMHRRDITETRAAGNRFQRQFRRSQHFLNVLHLPATDRPTSSYSCLYGHELSMNGTGSA
jgi:hypothetical protein